MVKKCMIAKLEGDRTQTQNTLTDTALEQLIVKQRYAVHDKLQLFRAQIEGAKSPETHVIQVTCRSVGT
jgi:hypothetical protein